MEFVNARLYKKQVKRLYRSAFPRNERAPFWLLMKRCDTGRDTLYALIDDNEFIGLVYTIKTEKMVYVFFLAIEEKMRGKGYGTEVLKKLSEMYPDLAISLMIEDPDEEGAENLDERINRLKFYERNGFRRLSIKINEAGVNYELLGTDDTVTQADFLMMMKDYVGPLLFKILYRRTKTK